MVVFISAGCVLALLLIAAILAFRAPVSSASVNKVIHVTPNNHLDIGGKSMRIEIQKLSETAIIPTCGSDFAAGYDMYADGDFEIAPGQTVFVGTGIAMAIPEGYAGLLFPRSGIASKRGLRLANCVGVIDADYRGEIKAAIHSDSTKWQTIARGERVAQLVLVPFLSCEFDAVKTLSETKRGAGGFGSTGK